MTKAEELQAVAEGRGCLGKAKDDEPVFILVAHDVLAASVVREWARAGERVGAAPHKIDEAYALADRMDAWRDANGGKVPD